MVLKQLALKTFKNRMVEKMDMLNENTNNAVQKYKEIMQRYRSGEFGNDHLTLAQILEAAGEPDFFDSLTVEDVDELLNQSSGMLRAFFARLKEKKLNLGDEQKPIKRSLYRKDS